MREMRGDIRRLTTEKRYKQKEVGETCKTREELKTERILVEIMYLPRPHIHGRRKQ